MKTFYSFAFYGLARLCVISMMMLAVTGSSSVVAATASQPAATRPAIAASAPASRPAVSAAQLSGMSITVDAVNASTGALKADERDLPRSRNIVARMDAREPRRLPGERRPATQPTTILPALEEPLVVQVFTLKHVEPKAVISAITTALGDQTAKVTAAPGNSIVVLAKKPALAAIRELLEELDVAPDRSAEAATVIAPLKKAKAVELAGVLERLVPELRECIAWPATNALILTGPSSAIDTARTLIDKLEAMPVQAAPPPPPPPPPPAPRPQKELTVKVFALKYARPDNTIIRALEAVAGPDSSVLADERTRSLIVAARPPGMGAVQTILPQLDRPPAEAEAPPARLRIRILWLVSGLPEDKSSAPPADLMPLVEELQRIGVTGLRLAAQDVVECMSGRDFRLRSSPMLANRCDLRVDGKVLDHQAGSEPCIELSADATEYAPYLVPEKNGYKVVETRDLCSIETTIVTPLGKAVVAGITPIDKMTAVFVVQVLPQ